LANESLIGKALAPVREQVVIATKFAYDQRAGRRRRRNGDGADRESKVAHFGLSGANHSLLIERR
jgi:aryl-alcohol dehydrogenase-like predicted oxidoreductase